MFSTKRLLVLAIVEFLEPSEARKAFTKLAYSKFKNVPLYLEWAPGNSLVERNNKEDKNEDKEDRVSEKLAEEVVQESAGGGEHNVAIKEEDEEPEPDTTLFVKNLNFKTTDEGLRKASYILLGIPTTLLFFENFF